MGQQYGVKERAMRCRAVRRGVTIIDLQTSQNVQKTENRGQWTGEQDRVAWGARQQSESVHVHMHGFLS
jgi:hypothetical protein